MPALTNQKHEAFCIEYYKTKNATQSAITVGLSPKTAAQAASRLLKKVNIVNRLEELGAKTVNNAILTVQERMEILSEIARGKQANFMTCSADGVWMHDLGPETLNSRALKSIQTTSMPYGGKESDLKIMLTKTELHDPVKAIAELNKMEGIYDNSTKINIDNRQQSVVIQVVSPNAQKLTESILNGELPKVT